MNRQERIEKIFVILMFAVMIAVGLMSVKDYGVSVDESPQRIHAIVTYRWLNKTLLGRNTFKTYASRGDIYNCAFAYYGTAIELLPTFFEDLYVHFHGGQEMPYGKVYRMRHVYTYGIYMIGLVCFYLLLRNIFDSRRAGILGVLSIFVFGRFFAHGIYNIKDIPFAMILVCVLFCAERVFSTDFSPKWCLFFSVTVAFVVSVRVVGALLPLLVLIFFLIDTVRSRTLKWKSLLALFSAYPIWILITPLAWKQPITFSLEYAFLFADYPEWTGRVAYAGELLPSTEVPADYLIRWIGMTVPPVTLLFAVVGIICFLISHRKCETTCKKILTISLIIIFCTLGYQSAARPTIYNGWRHAYYLLPMLVIFTVYGVRRIPERFPAKPVKGVVYALLGFSLIFNAVRTIQLHPHEYISYSILGEGSADMYERDYWYLSYYDLLLHIAETDPSPEVSVGVYDKATTWIFEGNTEMLPESAQKRILIENEEPDYLLVSYTNMPGIEEIDIPGYEEIYAETAYDMKLSSVFRKMK